MAIGVKRTKGMDMKMVFRFDGRCRCRLRMELCGSAFDKL
jgi:hypothetical protein